MIDTQSERVRPRPGVPQIKSMWSLPAFRGRATLSAFSCWFSCSRTLRGEFGDHTTDVTFAIC
jgi:hypothetical protein